MENSVNYVQDRSASFKHHVPSDIGPPSAMSAYDYVQNEKCKQMNKLRDWYLDAKETRETVDPVALRASFSTSRSFTAPTPAQEMDHHKGFLFAGIFLASAIGAYFFFIH